MSTLQEVVSKKFGKPAWELLTGDDISAGSIRQQIGYLITGSDEIITDCPFDQLKMTMSAAKFANDEWECVEVARMVYWLINKKDILPMVHCHKGFDLASRCLISIALFRKSLEFRTKHRGCPSVMFYRKIGIKTTAEEGLPNISSHFDNWSAFIGETLGA